MRISRLVSAALIFLLACVAPSDDKATNEPVVSFPEKAKDATIYEVNIRQHTAEGTFKAFENDLPRLKELGADMLWFMPIQPIGEKNRKGSLGSYYSIKDYKSVNPEFGTMDGFKSMVNKAKELGFFVIMDWVPNHTAWDHTWVSEHPEYYMTDSAARVVGRNLGMDPEYYKRKGMGDLVYESDWDDIALLNLYHEGAQDAMIDAMEFWVRDTNIDGFRVDHPTEEIPMFFWEKAADRLNPLKDLFWLAERDEARVHTVFHATYEWGLLSLIEKIGEGEASAEALHDHILHDMATYGRKAFRLNMITNHDRNAWEGTVFERFGDGVKAMAVFSFVSYGVPVIYSGQEAGMNKRLKFFEKDPIDWSDPDKYFSFYQTLNQLKADNPALWNGAYGAMPEKLEDGNEDVFSMRRTQGSNSVLAIINMSEKTQEVQLSDGILTSNYKELFTGQNLTSTSMTLAPWQYMVFTMP